MSDDPEESESDPEEEEEDEEEEDEDDDEEPEDWVDDLDALFLFIALFSPTIFWSLGGASTISVSIEYVKY